MSARVAAAGRLTELQAESGHEANGAAQPDGVLSLVALGARPSVPGRGRLAEVAHDPRHLALLGALPVSEALPGEEISAAEHAERHLPLDRREVLGRRPRLQPLRPAAYCAAMPGGQGYQDPRPVAPTPVERDESVREICRTALERLGEALPEAQLYCHLRVADVLRVVAAEGGLRLIYEVRREQGGICWRAAATREPQLVKDVRRDPDYMTTDESVCSEVAVPVIDDHDTLLVLDAEFPDRTFTPQEAEAVLAEAARLEAELAE